MDNDSDIIFSPTTKIKKERLQFKNQVKLINKASNSQEELSKKQKVAFLYI